MRVEVDCDEWYPYYYMHEVLGDERGKFYTYADVPDEKFKEYSKFREELNEWQDYLENLHKTNKIH